MSPPDFFPYWTDHAVHQAQARGVPKSYVHLVCANADRDPFIGGGRRALTISRKRLRALAHQIPAAIREHLDGLAVVVDSDGRTIITVLHASAKAGRRYRRGFH
jgi:hypothetical protein